MQFSPSKFIPKIILNCNENKLAVVVKVLWTFKKIRLKYSKVNESKGSHFICSQKSMKEH